MKRILKKNRIIILFLLIVLPVSLSLYIKSTAKGAYNDTTAVHIKADEIENSTLAIGTHLIHISALTDELYSIAKESASESGQNQIYYKSELADGTWFDITNASSLSDITKAGTPVDNAVIEALYFTYQTKSDKITYDLRTNTPVNIFDIRNPYDLKSMEELKPLKDQFGQMTGKDGAAEENMKLVEDFFATDVNTDETDECDKELAGLQTYYNELSSNKASNEEISAVSKVLGKIDSTRRAAVFTIVENALMQLANKLSGTAGDSANGSTEASAANTAENPSFNVDSGLLSAVNESLSNVTDSLTAAQGSMLDEGTTTMTKAENDLSKELIKDSLGSNQSACDTAVKKLIALQNIQDGVIGDKSAELELLNSTLVNAAQEKYVSGLEQGINSDYITAEANNSSYVVLNNIGDQNTDKLNVYRNELEFFIDAVCKRSENADAQQYIRKQIEGASGYYSKVAIDDFLDGANSTIDSHMKWLNQTLSDLMKESGQGSAAGNLAAKKLKLQEEKLKALDNNDLDKASSLEAQITDIDDQISDLQNNLTNQVKELNQDKSKLADQIKKTSLLDKDKLDNLKKQLSDTEAQLTEAEAQLSDDSIPQKIEELKEASLNLIADDSIDTAGLNELDQNIDSIKGFIDSNANIALDALKEIYKEMLGKKYLTDSSTFDDLIAKIEDIIVNNKDAFEEGLSTEELKKIIDDSDSGDNKGAVALIALSQYYEQTKKDNVKALMASQAQNEINTGDPLVFSRAAGTGTEYLPVNAIAAYCGYRYIWNDNLKKATLALGSKYYEFTAFSKTVVKDRQKSRTDKMTVAAQFKETVHIPEDYAYKEFGCDALYLDGTAYGVLVSDDLNDKAKDLFNQFIEKESEE